MSYEIIPFPIDPLDSAEDDLFEAVSHLLAGVASGDIIGIAVFPTYVGGETEYGFHGLCYDRRGLMDELIVATKELKEVINASGED
jgi:hypothetical protein